MLLDNYDEYARHARLYTGIHALKPKPKFRSESTAAAVNVDQTNTGFYIVDPKTAVSGAVMQPTPLDPSLNSMKGASGQELPTVALNTVVDIGVSSTSAAPPVTAVP